MSYKIYLINLERAHARLAAMKRKFDALGLSFERIAACDGRAMNREERQDFAKSRPRANGWLPGAIGCFRSHYMAWRAIASGPEEFGVVFEDDVHISSALPVLLNAMSPYLHDFDVARLEATKHRVLLNRNRVLHIGGIDLIEVGSETWGAGAYVLPKKTALALLLAPLTSHSPVDFFLFDKDTSEVARRHRVFQAVPALCVQSKFDAGASLPETHYGSDIEHNSGDTRLRHLLRIVGWRIHGCKNMLLGYRRIALAKDIVRL